MPTSNTNPGHTKLQQTAPNRGKASQPELFRVQLGAGVGLLSHVVGLQGSLVCLAFRLGHFPDKKHLSFNEVQNPSAQNDFSGTVFKSGGTLPLRCPRSTHTHKPRFLLWNLALDGVAVG